MPGDWHIIVDFDGTLTEVDADIYIASKLLDKPSYDRLTVLFRAYEATEITLETYFSAYLSLVDVKSPSFRDCIARVPIRRDIVELVASVASKTALTIASEGLDVYIYPILAHLDLSAIPVVCNRIDDRNGVAVMVPDPAAESCDRCVSCKGAFVRREKERSPGRKFALIGNGASDLCAAKEADIVFARDSLSVGCEKQGIPTIPWTTARDIQTTKAWSDIAGTV